ncbi:FAD-dependent oxidoreductase [Sporomusa sp. KB1]|jgi:hypothetical protein|uniref:FAD-dependent oxidoreductase n=1 Tax=Sporomusa sp. KB1 TaxID=943346 RepID=UPI00119E071C|nr:FAD-dependent oxidoreductase [Sporomusa sp. KB1]TWH52084.1 FAD dependent oxidoreductase [Sporomusa sp. KB1]
MLEEKDAKTATRTVRKAVNEPVQEVTADICVVGAGMAGISAALEAARLGRKVVLIDGLPMLGGQVVNSIIGTFCGLFSDGPHFYQFTHGIADDILRDLAATGGLYYPEGRRDHKVPLYDETALSRWIEKAVQAAGITVILGGILRGVTSKERRITTLEIATRYGDVRIAANGFVDATGDAALTWQTGLPCRRLTGDVYGSHTAILDGIDVNNHPTRDELTARQREKAKEYGLVRTDGIVFVFPARGTSVLNMTHVQTPLEPLAASAKALEGKDQIDLVVDFLRKEFPLAYGKARIRAYGLPGVRQTRWIVGRQQLTTADVFAGTHFSDAIGRTAWPIELHDKSEGYIWQPFAENHVHYIPLGALTPPDIDNLVAAGRCIDADVDALSSVRVHGPCIATGMAAAHALDLAGTGSVHAIDIAVLQERLKDNLVRTD